MGYKKFGTKWVTLVTLVKKGHVWKKVKLNKWFTLRKSSQTCKNGSHAVPLEIWIKLPSLLSSLLSSPVSSLERLLVNSLGFPCEFPLDFYRDFPFEYLIRTLKRLKRKPVVKMQEQSTKKKRLRMRKSIGNWPAGKIQEHMEKGKRELTPGEIQRANVELTGNIRCFWGEFTRSA